MKCQVFSVACITISDTGDMVPGRQLFSFLPVIFFIFFIYTEIVSDSDQGLLPLQCGFYVMIRCS